MARSGSNFITSTHILLPEFSHKAMPNFQKAGKCYLDCAQEEGESCSQHIANPCHRAQTPIQSSARTISKSSFLGGIDSLEPQSFIPCRSTEFWVITILKASKEKPFLKNSQIWKSLFFSASGRASLWQPPHSFWSW